MLFCFCLIGDQSNVTVSPSGRSSTFAFSRKQKKIPSALKEVTWSCTLPIMQWHAALALCNVTVMKVSVSTTKLMSYMLLLKLNLAHRCLPTLRIPPWLDICKDPKATRNRGRGCGSSLRTKSSTLTPLVKYATFTYVITLEFWKLLTISQ